MKPAAGAARRGAMPGDTASGTAPVSRPAGYARAFSVTTRTSNAPAGARLADVTAPALVAKASRILTFPIRGPRLTGSAGHCADRS